MRRNGRPTAASRETTMHKLLALASCLVLFAGCAAAMTPAQAKSQVQQLITLYEENKPKFVVQKQEIQQAGSCDRATALRTAIDEMAAEAAMSPEPTETITMVQMELQQAEKACLDK
jgi:hypothetical protein